MLFIFILLIIYSVGRFTDLSSLALSTSSPIYTLLTFHFLHFEWYHLAINLFLFVFYWRYMRWSRYSYTMPIIIIASITAGYLARYDVPTVGCSAIIMSMAGILVATLKPRLILKNLILFAVAFAITSLAAHINTLIHIYAFSISLILARIAGNKRICRPRSK